MRFKMRTSSSRIVVLLLVMMTSLICHPSLASGSRDLIDDRAPDKFARSGRYYPVRNRNIVEELQPYVLEQVRNRIFPPFPYQHNANHRLRGRGRSEGYYPVRNRNFEKEFQSNDLEQVRNRIFPRPPQAGPSGVRPPQAGPSGARPPQAGTTQPVYRGDLPQPSEDFPLEDPPPHYSEHEKAAPPPPYASLGQPAQPLSAADIHQPPPAYDQIYPKVPRPAAAGLAQGILYLGQRVLDQIAEGNPRPNIDPFDPQSQDAQRIFGLITPKIQRERQTLQDMEMKYATKIEGTRSYEFVFKATDIDPRPTRTAGWREPVKCRVRANPTPMLRDFTISGLTCERKKMDLRGLSLTSIQYYPAGRGRPNPGPVNAQSAVNAGQVGRILGLGEHVPDQRPEPNPRPNIDPFDAQSQDAQRIFELIKPKIQRERQTLHDMQMKDATKIEGTPSFEFVFKAKDIVPRTNGWREPVPVKCRVRANPTPMLRDFTISGLTCERKKMDLRRLSVTSIQYYPASRGKRASSNKIHNRVSPSIQRSRSGSLQSVSSNDDHPPPSYESVVGANPPSYQSLYPGSSQSENPSRSSSLSAGSRVEDSNPMGQTYIHKNSPEAKRVFSAIKPQLLRQHPEFRKIRLAPRVLKQELASSSSPFSVNYKFTLTATVLVKKRPFYRQDKVHRIPCLVQVYKTNSSLNVYEMLCTCSSY